MREHRLRCNRFGICKLPEPVTLCSYTLRQCGLNNQDRRRTFQVSALPPITMYSSPSPLCVHTFHIQLCSGLGIQEVSDGECGEYTFLQRVFKPLQHFPYSL